MSRTPDLAPPIPWMLNLATRMLARSLNMPEPLVHGTGVSCSRRCRRRDQVGKTLCPIRLLRLLRSWFRYRPSTAPQPKENCHDPPSLFLRRALLADAIVSGVGPGADLRRRRFARCSTCPKRCCARPACS